MPIICLINAQHLTQMLITPQDNNMNHSRLPTIPANKRTMQILHIIPNQARIKWFAITLALALQRKQNSNAEFISAQFRAHTTLQAILVSGVAEAGLDFADCGV